MGLNDGYTHAITTSMLCLTISFIYMFKELSLAIKLPQKDAHELFSRVGGEGVSNAIDGVKTELNTALDSN